MNSLGCFKDKDKLKQELLKPDHNTGKYKFSAPFFSRQIIQFIVLQKKWYTSYSLIESSENRPLKMKQKSLFGPVVAPLTRPARGWITVNWTGSPTANSARDRRSRRGGIFTGQHQLLATIDWYFVRANKFPQFILHFKALISSCF